MTARDVDEAEFERQLEGWFRDFHAEVKPMSAEEMRKRVNSYRHQEDLFEEKIGFVLATLGRTPGRTLDVGSSAGGLSVALARKGIETDGIEPSAAGVEVSRLRARRAGVDNVRFQVGVGERIPFPDAHFDFVISLAVLEHVQDVAQVTREIFRVLKPGGHFYCEVPNYLCPFEPHYKMAWLPMMPKPLAKVYVRMRGGYPDFIDTVNYLNRHVLGRHLREAGFADIRDVYADFLAGKASGEPWASRAGRLAKIPWAAPAVRLVFDVPPTAWLLNRIVCFMARKAGS